MISVEDIAKMIQERPGVFFQVSIPGTPFSAGKKTQAEALADSPSLAEYFTRIIKSNGGKSLLIRLYTKNGSSFKQRSEQLVSLAPTEAVATKGPVATPVATKPATVQQLAGINLPTTGRNMNVEDQIALGVLRVEHKMVLEQRDRLDRDNKELQKKVDQLHAEKLDLVRQTTVQKEKNDLEIERAKLSVEREAKAGLSGIVGDLKELAAQPEVLKAITGFIKPDHPMFKNEQPIGAVDQPLHSDPEASVIIRDLNRTMGSWTGAQVAQAYVIFQQYVQYPERLQEHFNQLQQQPTQ